MKIARGTYQLARFADADVPTIDAEFHTSAPDVADEAVDAAGRSAGTLTEQDFYASFAEWLEENDAVTVAAALGGVDKRRTKPRPLCGDRGGRPGWAGADNDALELIGCDSHDHPLWQTRDPLLRIHPAVGYRR